LKAHEAQNQTREKDHDQVKTRNIEKHYESELWRFLRMWNLFLRAPEQQAPVRLP
jgi:hypothetical protein